MKTSETKLPRAEPVVRLRCSSVEKCEGPVGLQAAKQCFPVHWHHADNTPVAPSNYWSADPMPTTDFPRRLHSLIGRKRGRCVVIGYFGKLGDREYCVTKCLCGGYELLRTKTLQRKPGGEHMCARCRTLNHYRFLNDNPDKTRPR